MKKRLKRIFKKENVIKVIIVISTIALVGSSLTIPFLVGK